ncbi:hypothetical protein AMK26_23590 [Streptomyces sp. CB03234]|uniref:DUF6907 domain-containing protein n=1 Tax=Streptomyces sp. (strain CB03234) TaxID=1703937 RepID=UPI00093E55B0|nr:hypothetical protein [Streptomyces sp. CB03234]OKK02600.1 hypothetical protein AMK26_23590 [Streptomyces sp. CB03234]
MTDTAMQVTRDEATEPVPLICPPWCAGSTKGSDHGAHESTEVQWTGPSGPSGAAALSASIALLCDDEADGHEPEIWFGTSGSWCELDLAQLGSVIRELEEYTVALHALRHRYAAVLAGTDLTSTPIGDPAPSHPVEITAPCPAWCKYRTEGHGADCLQDRYHCGAERSVELTLQHPEKGRDGAILPERVEVHLEQLAYGRLPALALAIEGHGGGFGYLSLTEARQLRADLGELIAVAEECATPDALPLLETVTAHMGANVVEDPRLDPRSLGYAVGDSSPGGKLWVCVPTGLSEELREQTVRNLLAGATDRHRRKLWEGDTSLHISGDRAAWAEACKRIAA